MFRTLSQALSGYVHAASVHVLEMYGGNPPRFRVSGMRGTPRETTFVKQAAHYFSRSLAMLMLAAHGLGDTSLFEELRALRDRFETAAGLELSGDADAMVRALRRNGSDV
jgi:hypothetical protein